MTYLIIAGLVLALCIMGFVAWTVIKIAAITDKFLEEFRDKPTIPTAAFQPREKKG